MIKLLDINALNEEDISRIWQMASENKNERINGSVAWSFEGNGIRTRTSFIQAFQKLGLSYIELPNFLKTGESVQDLAGYMDSFYSMYVIRDKDHSRMAEFANASSRPVLNAMSGEAHPCEVLTDAFYLKSKYQSLQTINILLWGPVTNVFKSWHSLAGVMDINLIHYCPSEYHCSKKGVHFSEHLTGQYDVVITDAWPSEFSNNQYTLTQDTLSAIGNPELLPVPPISIGNELSFSPTDYEGFSGYDQKSWLLPVQASIITHMLK